MSYGRQIEVLAYSISVSADTQRSKVKIVLNKFPFLLRF